jgi:hypothetical protein
MARQVKRLSVQIGQQLEIEYQLVPETKQYAPDVEVERVFAYNGAVRVEVTPMLRANVPSLLRILRIGAARPKASGKGSRLRRESMEGVAQETRVRMNASQTAKGTIQLEVTAEAPTVEKARELMGRPSMR